MIENIIITEVGADNQDAYAYIGKVHDNIHVSVGIVQHGNVVMCFNAKLAMTGTWRLVDITYHEDATQARDGFHEMIGRIASAPVIAHYFSSYQKMNPATNSHLFTAKAFNIVNKYDKTELANFLQRAIRRSTPEPSTERKPLREVKPLFVGEMIQKRDEKWKKEKDKKRKQYRRRIRGY